MSNNATLERTTFGTSRLLEFFTEKELQMQIGFDKSRWAIALVKELIDNALDACESVGIAPEIELIVEPNAISVKDNGPGMPVETLERSLDYSMRVSDKSYYVSPTRGQLGNALKCVWAVPFVADGEHGRVEVSTRGVKHMIDVTLDRIAQTPKIHHTPSPDGFVKSGTFVKLHWADVSRLLEVDIRSDFYNVHGLIQSYAAFNPHVSLTFVCIDSDGDVQKQTIHRTTSEWKKWLPSQPTSPHWYSAEKLRSLIAAYLNDEQNGGRARTVREFVSEFHGLKGTAKQKRVTEDAGMSGAYLRDMVDGGDVGIESVRMLLSAMKSESRPVKPSAFGILGEAHLTRYMVERCFVEPDSIKYKKMQGEVNGLPFVLEVVCGWYVDKYFDEYIGETMVGLNWSPALQKPFDMDALLDLARVDSYDPVVLLIHLACPRLEFTDRGKSRLTLPRAVEEALEKAVQSVTKSWRTLKRQTDMENRVRQREAERWRKMQKARELNLKEAAYQVMEEAYLKASVNNTLPANARQIMYAARPLVLELTGGKIWKESSYFTQKVLPDFMDEHSELTADWDVVFDARGHLVEPHTRFQLGLGTLEVRKYIQDWQHEISEATNVSLERSLQTRGPTNRYRFALFVEKEGFNELFAQSQISARYDLALMSTKGMTVTAARQLIEELSECGVTILVIHDFDKSGFSILHTMKSDTRRYQFKTPPNVVDLGLRLADVQEMSLASEPVAYPGKRDPRIKLRECGATPAECDFLVRASGYKSWTGERVELNAMTSGQLIDWLASKLKAARVEKVVPERDVLEQAYRRARQQAVVQKAIDHVMSQFERDNEIAVPNNLDQLVKDRILGSTQSWDAAIGEIACEPRVRR